MMFRTTFLGACVGMIGVGCAFHQTPIELTSSDFDLQPLVGEWRGQSINNDNGRTGRIAFTLNAGGSSAFGQVILLPVTQDTSAAATDRMIAVAKNAAAQRGEVLTIHFVRKDKANVVGTLDPYQDPDCSCRVSTTFQGSFRDARTIEGTFTSTREGHSPASGRWTVTRLRKL